MINKNTILSVYTDKQTLLEYLTKIETALDKAVLTSSQLVYEGANNYHFKFVFEDDSSIETPSITLVQPISKVDFLANGNSVHFVFTLMDGETITTQTINLLKPVMAAAVRDGVLYLTLSDGTEVSAGSITASFGATTFNGEVIVHGNLQVNGNIDASTFGNNIEITAIGLTLDNLPNGMPYIMNARGNIIHAHIRGHFTWTDADRANKALSLFNYHKKVNGGYANSLLLSSTLAGLDDAYDPTNKLTPYISRVWYSDYSELAITDAGKNIYEVGKTYYVDFRQDIEIQ